MKKDVDVIVRFDVDNGRWRGLEFWRLDRAFLVELGLSGSCHSWTFQRYYLRLRLPACRLRVSNSLSRSYPRQKKRQKRNQPSVPIRPRLSQLLRNLYPSTLNHQVSVFGWLETCYCYGVPAPPGQSLRLSHLVNPEFSRTGRMSRSGS